MLALTSVLQHASVAGAARAGATGYLLKDAEAEELRTAIRAAAAGRVQLAPDAAARLMREVRAPDSPKKLSERETEVLRLVARGYANKTIASELGTTERTVKAAPLRFVGLRSFVGFGRLRSVFERGRWTDVSPRVDCWIDRHPQPSRRVSARRLDAHDGEPYSRSAPVGPSWGVSLGRPL